jgi:hypothetical protein
MESRNVRFKGMLRRLREAVNDIQEICRDEKTDLMLSAGVPTKIIKWFYQN